MNTPRCLPIQLTGLQKRAPICLTCLLPLTAHFIHDSHLGGGMILIDCIECENHGYVGITEAAWKCALRTGKRLVTDMFAPDSPRAWLRHWHARLVHGRAP